MIIITLISVSIWISLLTLWGNFWRNQPILESEQTSNQALSGKPYPAIRVVIPARNEAETIGKVLISHFQQDYPGKFSIILVDDGSSDRTADVAKSAADQLHHSSDLQIISGKPLPSGWTGKLWALSQGIEFAQIGNPDYILLTDADICHDWENLKRLVHQAEHQKLDLVSIMVRLRCESFWEQLLIPAFVFFFKQLYPFNWANNPQKKIAAAAGGCILIRNATLQQIGGIGVVRTALIDDCALAKAVKSQGGKIWLGLSSSTVSLRPYEDWSSIWNMVARTAFTQLNYSVWLLLGTVVGMVLVYLAAPLAVVWGVFTQNWFLVCGGIFLWCLTAIAYYPTVKFYRIFPSYALALPLIGLIYTLMTIDSALRHWRGKGGAWKGRVYEINT